jgi:Domain of unknown function (DUF4288)
MGFVPTDAQWFLADLVVEHRIEGDSRNVVHLNTVLVRADSAKEAYARAMQLGADAEMTFENTESKTVAVSFRGLHQLSVIHDELEHGAELWYREKIGLTEEEVLDLVRHGSLAVFSEPQPSQGPNYMPKEIMDQLIDHFGEDEMDHFMEQRGDRL